MNDIKQLQEEAGLLELLCLNSPKEEVREKWPTIAEIHMFDGTCVWSQINDEGTLIAAIKDAKKLLYFNR